MNHNPFPVPDERELFGAINFHEWRNVPHIKNKIATELDVENGRAVFVENPKGAEHVPLDI